jgi:hypothetical protein
MSDLLDALKTADTFFWDSMEKVTASGTKRVRCRHCQMVRDIGRREKPEDAFRKVEYYDRKCALSHLAVDVRKAVKSQG